MIDINYFETFLRDVFSDYFITVDDFKENLKFIDIDCFIDKPYRLTLALSSEDICIATISKEPELDFSLYDYTFRNMDEAKAFILSIKKSGLYPFTLA